MKKTTLKRSRKSFFMGYIFSLISGFLIFSVYALGIFPDFLIYLLSFPIFYLLLLPEYNIINNRYLIKEENVEEVTGIFTKKKTIIPWNLVTDVTMEKSLFGMVLGYGSVVITSIGTLGSKITIKGISNPEKTLRRIENKIGKKIEN